MASAQLPFEEVRELGTGVSGRVIQARLTAALGGSPAGSQLAVKLAHAGAPPQRSEQFEQEIRLGSQLSHPALTPVLASGPGWFAMPWHRGGQLNQVLAGAGPWEADPLRKLCQRLAEGLAELHRLGWLHGDCKPENVLFDDQGQPHWIDLGFAASTQETQASGQGSPRYMAPEELRGRSRSTASEVFALGILFHELATGEHPFLPRSTGTAEAPMDLASRFDRSQAERPSALAPQLSPGLEALLESMLHPSEAQRPSAQQVAEQLKRLRPVYPQPAGECPFGPQRRVPFVGRQAELAKAEAAWAQTASPPGRGGGAAAIWVEAPEGFGSSRFVDEFARRVRRGQDPPVVLWTRSSRQADALPLQPLLELLRSWLHTSPGRPPGQAARKRLLRWVPEASARFLLDALENGPSTPDLGEHLVRWLIAAADDHGLVVVIDNTDLLGAASLEVIERAARELTSRRILLLLVQDPDRRPTDARALDHLQARLERSLRVERLPLHAYGMQEVAELVAMTFTADAPRKRIARSLLHLSEGRPALLTELLGSLEAQGQTTPTARGWSVRKPPEEWPEPESRARLLDQRLAALPLDLRLWLQRFAVANQDQALAFVARAFGHITEAELTQVADSLVAAGWLMRSGDRFRFRRGSLRAAALRSTGRERRARLHARVARALASSDSPQDPFRLAFHLRMAGDPESLLQLLEDKLEDLGETQPARRVRTLTGWGLEALEAQQATAQSTEPDSLEAESRSPEDPLPAGPESKSTAPQAQRNYDALEANLLEAAADASGRLGLREQQRKWLDRLADLDLDEQRRPALAARVYLRHGRFAAERGSYGLARGMLRNARLLAERTGDQLTVQEARLARGEVHLASGALDEAREDLMAVVLDEVAAPPVLRAEARTAVGLVDLLEDRFERALDATENAERELGQDRRPRAVIALANAYLLRSRIHRILGLSQAAWEELHVATTLAPRADHRRLEVEIAARRGRMLLESGHTREAELELREARWQAGEVEDSVGRTTAELFLGILLAQEGSSEGSELLLRVRRELGRLGLRRLQALAEALTARVALATGDLGLASSRSAEALIQLELYGAELQDRIVIDGTAAVIAAARGDRVESRALERRTLNHIQREVSHVESSDLRKSLRQAAGAGVRAAFSADGPIYPHRRIRLEGFGPE